MGQPTPKIETWAAAGRQPRIAIIGAGMSGICAVVKLREAGYHDLTVYEKADRVGGTWRENTYPGLSCDVPSYWYSFTFALNPDWTHRYAYGTEIQTYMEDTARRFGVTDIVKFNTAVSELVYLGPHWRLRTADGEETVYDIVISAAGVLHHPAVPEIRGLETFGGEAFHSARWDHSVQTEGKRVGVIGTGSTASQIVGAITPKVRHLTLFQRTAQWMVPLGQKTYSERWKRLVRRYPFLLRWLYKSYYRLGEWTFVRAVLGNRRMANLIDRTCHAHLTESVADPKLRAKLTPDYQPGCKRLIFCSDFYAAITRENASLVTDAIDRVEAAGVRTADGKLHELDVLVLATGFDPSRFILPTRVVGEDGAELSTVWDGAPRAHRAVAVPGFPNFWMIEGPTSPIGNLSLITISEYQAGYIVKCLDEMKRSGLAALAAKPEAFRAYNDELSQAVTTTLWATGGCKSWYLDKTGKPNLYPWSPRRFRKEMRRPDLSEYRQLPASEFETTGSA